MRTTALVNETPSGDFTPQEVDLDGPRAGEVLVRIVATGLCHTDISVRDTLPAEMFPRILGHEGAGVVEEVGAGVDGIATGDHVVLSFASCRDCSRCAAGMPGYCEKTVELNYLGFRDDGSTTYTRDGALVYGSFFGQSSFARHAIAGAGNVVVVDPALDLSRLGPYGCSFQTGAGTVLDVLAPGSEDSLAVYGAGAVGLAAIAAAAGSGVGTIVAVDPQASRREVAASYGALTVDPTEGGVADRVREMTGGGSSHAIDTTSLPAVIKEGVQALRPRGTMATLGLGAAEFTLDAVDLMMHGKTVRGVVEGDADPLEMVPRLLALAAAGRFDVDRLVTPYPFAEIGRAIADSEAARVVKPVLVW
ncbi:NAD(P)-dependent alcohol dehydrogenase [Nocardioides pacificus]